MLGRAKAYHLKSPGGLDEEELKLAVSTKRRIQNLESIYVRLELQGDLVFKSAADPTLEVIGLHTTRVIDGTRKSFDERVQGGTEGSRQIVFSINVLQSAIGPGDTVVIDVTDDLAVTRKIGISAARISAHYNADDAITGMRAIGTLFDSVADVIEVTNGVGVHIFEVSPAIAEVKTGFLSFVSSTRSSPVVGQAKLGWIRVAPRQIDESEEILNAATGEAIQTADLVEDNGVDIEIQGDLSIGAFSIIPDTINAAGARSANCPGASASVTQPDRGTLVDNVGQLLVGEAGEIRAERLGRSGPLDAHISGDRRVYSLCVNVDVVGMNTNLQPIPSGTYTAIVRITGAAENAGGPTEVGTASVGKIGRNGSVVKIAKLTDEAGYNQTIVIMNLGNRPAPYFIGEFTTEPGTTVDLSAEAEATRVAGLNVVPPFQLVVLSVSDLLTFTGNRRRTTATIGLDAAVEDIQVVTIQKNLHDGSTDTLLYLAEPSVQ